jgi:hypothetical protein
MLVDWEVLRSTKTKGHFLLARKMTASIPDLQLWLSEALLGASAADEIEAQQLLRLPESFPFSVSIGVADLRKHEGFNIHRQGLDMDMVALRKVKLEPPPKPTKKSKTEKASKSAPADLFDMDAHKGIPKNSEPAPISHVQGMAEQRKIKEAIRNKLVRTLSERAVGLPKIQASFSKSEHPLAAPSAECAEQFRQGKYFACISLTQAVLEAVIRHVWQINFKKKPDQDSGFARNLESLHKKRLVSDEMKDRFDQIWGERSSFLHLNPTKECDEQKLEELAGNTLKLLNDLEQAFFGVFGRNGVD